MDEHAERPPDRWTGGWHSAADALLARAVAEGRPTEWFEELYAAAAAGEVPMPWDREEPHPLLRDWLDERTPPRLGRRAVVVGCGLGADAELVAGAGFDTVAFDVSGTAVRLAERRHVGSTVRYRRSDLLNLPAAWHKAFDLVVEVSTVQALPAGLRAALTAAVAGLASPGGTIVSINAKAEQGEAPPDRPPFPLTRQDVNGFAVNGVCLVQLEELPDPRRPGRFRWRAELRRQPA